MIARLEDYATVHWLDVTCVFGGSEVRRPEAWRVAARLPQAWHGSTQHLVHRTRTYRPTAHQYKAADIRTELATGLQDWFGLQSFDLSHGRSHVSADLCDSQRLKAYREAETVDILSKCELCMMGGGEFTRLVKSEPYATCARQGDLHYLSHLSCCLLTIP